MSHRVQLQVYGYLLEQNGFYDSSSARPSLVRKPPMLVASPLAYASAHPRPYQTPRPCTARA
jgi:hypothetical protein